MPSSSQEIRRVSVVGAGPMGSQIALHVAMRGYRVVLHDANAAALERCIRFMEQPEAALRAQAPRLFESAGLSPTEAYRSITCTPIAEDAADCDLLLESVTESVDVKRKVFAQFHALCPSRTIFATNSSTIVPSALAEATGRPEKFAAVHFAYGEWIVEIMTHPGTSAETLAAINQFARRVADLTVQCRLESRGYALNRLLMSINAAALDLAAEGVATPEDIDRLCMRSFRSEIGPFGALDGIGLDTVYAITRLMVDSGGDQSGRRRLALLKPYLDRGMLGRKSGEGFYRYPNPAYQQPGFTSNITRRGADETPPAREVVTAPPPVAPPAEQHRMGCFHLSMVDAPLSSAAAPLKFAGQGALIVGNNPTADALRRCLEAMGVPVFLVDAGADREDPLLAVDRLFQTRAITHLFLCTARDAQAAAALEDETRWRRRREVGVAIPFQIGQRWLKHVDDRKRIGRAALVAVTALGGDFGLSGHGPAVEGGALAGLLKSLRVEVEALDRVKVIDAPDGEPPDALAGAICRELATRSADVEVAYVNGKRRVIRAVRRRVQRLPRRQVEPGSVWVVSGGARGVTAVSARRFARRHGLRLHLLGSSPAPQIDPSWRELPEKEVLRRAGAEAEAQGRKKWEAIAQARKMLEIDRNLQACAADGVQAHYHPCDVGDREQVRAVLANIRESDGPIYGVIHGAGTDNTLPFSMTPLRSLRQVAHGKLDGAAALMELTRDDPLRYFIGFGSTSGRFGAACNADYALANDMMSKMLDYFGTLRPECVSLSLHWTAWDDVGMCMRPRSRRGMEALKVELMPAEEGAAHMIDAIERCADDRELIIAQHPGGVHSAHCTMSQTDTHADSNRSLSEHPLGAATFQPVGSPAGRMMPFPTRFG